MKQNSELDQRATQYSHDKDFRGARGKGYKNSLGRRRKARVVPKQPLSVGILPNLLAHNVWQAGLGLWSRFGTQIGRQRAGQGIFAAMALIDANPGVSPSDIGLQLGIDRATIGDFAHRLLLDRSIEYKQSPEDRRRKGIYLTEKGGVEFKKLLQEVLTYNAKATRVLSSQELAQLCVLLRRLVRP